MADTCAQAFNIADLREAARKRLPRGLFEFVARGSGVRQQLRERGERAPIGLLSIDSDRDDEPE